MSRAAAARIKRVFDSDGSDDDVSSSSSASDAPLPPPKPVPAPIPKPPARKRARARTSPPPPAIAESPLIPPVAADAVLVPPVAVVAVVPKPPAVPALVPALVLPVFVPPATPHMRLQTSAVQHFYTVISTLAPNLLTETNVTFNASGMYLTAVDDSHSIMVDWRVTKESMEGLYSGNHNFRIKIDMEEFVDRIKAGKKFESMELALDSADGGTPEKLVVVFKRPDLTRTITMLLMQDDDNEPLEIPPVAYDHFVTMPSTTFKDTINSIQRNSDHVCFIYNVSAPNAETGLCDYAFSICGNTQLSQTTTRFETVGGSVSDNSNVKFNMAAAPAPARPAIALKSSFLLARVEKIVRVTNGTRFVRIYPAVPEGPNGEPSKPMRITYEITTLGPLSFYIAPVYEPDDAPAPAAAPPRALPPHVAAAPTV